LETLHEINYSIKSPSLNISVQVFAFTEMQALPISLAG
jgi:hypothetical protein